MSLDEDSRRTLALLADVIIPPSEEFAVPGAGDAAICAAVVNDAGARMAGLEGALRALEALAQARHGAGFATLDAGEREALALAFRDTQPQAASLVENLIIACYYRDDRVMASLGVEPRAPHPQGYALAAGDWSLLDPVRRRSQLYRRTD